MTWRPRSALLEEADDDALSDLITEERSICAMVLSEGSVRPAMYGGGMDPAFWGYDHPPAQTEPRKLEAAPKQHKRLSPTRLKKAPRHEVVVFDASEAALWMRLEGETQRALIEKSLAKVRAAALADKLAEERRLAAKQTALAEQLASDQRRRESYTSRLAGYRRTNNLPFWVVVDETRAECAARMSYERAYNPRRYEERMRYLSALKAAT